jgi:hypothetical protein
MCIHYICVLILLLYMCSHTTTIYVSSYRRADDTVRASSAAEREQVLEFTALASSGPHTTLCICVSSYYCVYVCPHTTVYMCVLILLCIM